MSLTSTCATEQNIIRPSGGGVDIRGGVDVGRGVDVGAVEVEI